VTALVRTLALAAPAAALLVATPLAAAQNTDLEGTVPSSMRLSLDAASGFASFPAGPGSHELHVGARVTATDSRTRRSVADGDVVSGHRLGRMASSASVLERALQATVGPVAFQPLSLAVEPPLIEFRQPVANKRATVRLRQRIDAGERPRGTYSKTVLITLSTNAP
jgi:hypothetical protein